MMSNNWKDSHVRIRVFSAWTLMSLRGGENGQSPRQSLGFCQQLAPAVVAPVLFWSMFFFCMSTTRCRFLACLLCGGTAVDSIVACFFWLCLYFCYAPDPVANSWQLRWLRQFCVERSFESSSCLSMKSFNDLLCKCAHWRVLCVHVLISVSCLLTIAAWMAITRAWMAGFEILAVLGLFVLMAMHVCAQMPCDLCSFSCVGNGMVRAW